MPLPDEVRRMFVQMWGEDRVADIEAELDAETDAVAFDQLKRIADEAEADRFRAEVERDAAMGSLADWPDL